MFSTIKVFFWSGRGGMGASLLLSLCCTSGLYFANLFIMNYTFQPNLCKGMEQNFDIPFYRMKQFPKLHFEDFHCTMNFLIEEMY